jgi:hypothetical protein
MKGIYWVLPFFFFFFLRQGLTNLTTLAWNLQCSPGWPQTQGLPASASQVLGLQVHSHQGFTFCLLFNFILRQENMWSSLAL